jgi:flavin-dependent dehydrogenase
MGGSLSPWPAIPIWCATRACIAPPSGDRCSAIPDTSAGCSPPASPTWPLVACDAPSARLDRARGPGWLAVGDAASSFDPISAQGIHKALADALLAADAIAVWLGRGDARALDRYAAGVASRFDDYLQNRAYLYSLERRWVDAPFWARRQVRASWSGGGRASDHDDPVPSMRRGVSR